MDSSIQEYLERARLLIDEGGMAKLRYAALELRSCMEAITYEKIRSSSLVPERVLETWQPPQAVKALLEYDEYADATTKLYMGSEAKYGEPSNDMRLVGEYRTFSLKWLQKHYNKVGSRLHAPIKRGGVPPDDEARLGQYLREVVKDIEYVLGGNFFSFRMGGVITFNCEVCNKDVSVSEYRATTKKEVECLHPNCDAEYSVDLTDPKDVRFNLKVAEFECGKCGAKILLEKRKLAIDMDFSCASCKSPHRIVNQDWIYCVEPSEEEGNG